MKNRHFLSSSRAAGSAQPENTALVSLGGWSEGTMGASLENCRQMHPDTSALWMEVLPAVVLMAIQSEVKYSP